MNIRIFEHITDKALFAVRHGLGLIPHPLELKFIEEWDGSHCGTVDGGQCFTGVNAMHGDHWSVQVTCNICQVALDEALAHVDAGGAK